MVTKMEIIKPVIEALYGASTFNDEKIKQIIEEEAEKIIDLEGREEDGVWRTLQHNDPSLPHGFIYYSCNMAKLQDLLYAIEVHKMLNNNGAEPAP